MIFQVCTLCLLKNSNVQGWTCRRNRYQEAKNDNDYFSAYSIIKKRCFPLNLLSYLLFLISRFTSLRKQKKGAAKTCSSFSTDIQSNVLLPVVPFFFHHFRL